MMKLTRIAAVATVVSAVLVIGASNVDLMVDINATFVPLPYPLIITLFVMVAILILLQWYLWIAMLMVCVRQKRFAWGTAVLFGLSWGAALFYYLHYRNSTSRSSTAAAM